MLNNSASINIDIEKYFPELIDEYLYEEKFKDKHQLLNAIFLSTCRWGKERLAQLSLDCGADIDARDNFDNTALMLAARDRNIEIVKMLLNNNANINAQDRSGMTALMFAVHKGHIEVAQMLINAGADVTAQDNVGRTVFRWCQHDKLLALLNVLDGRSQIDATVEKESN